MKKQPYVVKLEKDTEVSLCGCKESNNAPYCSGAHANTEKERKIK